jgi:hypothetical protein
MGDEVGQVLHLFPANSTPLADNAEDSAQAAGFAFRLLPQPPQRDARAQEDERQGNCRSPAPR